MRGTTTKETDHPHTGIRWPFRVGRFPHTSRGAIHLRGLAGTARYSCRDRCRHRWLARMAKPGRLVGSKLIGLRKGAWR